MVAQLPPFPEIEVNNTRAVFFEDDEYERLLKTLPLAVFERYNIKNEDDPTSK